jgi:hypothetical protein
MLSEYALNLNKTIGISREGHEDSKKSLGLYVISGVVCHIFLGLATLALIQS